MKNPVLQDTLKCFEIELTKSRSHMLGYPVNLNYDYNLGNLYNFSINNVGDPFEFSNYIENSHKFEVEVINFFLQIYLSNKKQGWGYVTTGGTEGNHYGLFLAREKYPKGILYFSKDTHYSIIKIARLLRIDFEHIESLENGEINYDYLLNRLKKNKSRPAIFNLNYGTTVKGAIDDYKKVVNLCKKAVIKDFYIHYDAALFGMLLPFIKNSPKFKILNRVGAVNSVAISGHKFIGSPFPCGVVLTTKDLVNQIKTQVEYLECVDTTIPGSRNGHTPLILWSAIKTRGKVGFKKEAEACLKNAEYLHKKLIKMGIESNLNKFSNTVYFTKPPLQFCHKWQLATCGRYAHVVVMQHVTKEKIDEFLSDLSRP